MLPFISSAGKYRNKNFKGWEIGSTSLNTFIEIFREGFKSPEAIQ